MYLMFLTPQMNIFNKKKKCLHLHDYHGFWVKFMICLYVRTSFPLPCVHGWSHSWTRKIIGYNGSVLPPSHIGVDPMVSGTHPYVRKREHTPEVPNNKLPKKKKFVKYSIISSKFQNFLSKMYLMFLTPQMNIFNKKKNVCIYMIIMAFEWNLWCVFMLELLFLSFVCTDGATLGQEKLLDTPGVLFLPLT